MSDGFNEMPVRGKHLHNVDAPDETAVATLPAIATNLDPSLSEGTLVALSTDLGGNLRVTLAEGTGGGALVDVTDRADREVGVVSLDAATITALNDGNDSVTVANFPATQAVSGTVDLSAGTLAALEDVTATVTGTVDIGNFPVTQAVSGTVDLSATSLAALESIDLNATTVTALTAPQALSVRGATVSDSNPIPVTLQENPGTTVDSGVLTQANVAPGATATLAGPAVGTGTGKLIEVTAHASVRIKVELKANGSTRRVFFVDPTGNPLVYSPKDRDLIFAASGNTFSVVITNMDNLRTADVYASLAHVEG